MKWFFESSLAASRSAAGESGRQHGHGALNVPSALLKHHGARVLDPARAVLLPGQEPPKPTVYRTSTLLIPGSVLASATITGIITQVLNGIGIDLLPPVPDQRKDDRDEFDLPYVTVLVPLPGHRAPVVVDAWVALQTLRVAGITDEQKLDLEQQKAYQAAVEQISLEHLLVTSSIGGSPITNGGGGITGGTGSGGDVSGPTSTSSYLFSGGDPRTPVSVLFDPPPRNSRTDGKSVYGRRPVVAVLDTGVRAHPWLDVQADGTGGYTMVGSDSFIAVDDDIQAAILAKGDAARAKGDWRRQLIRDASDKPAAATPLLGEVNPALGHSTFISGIVRQAAPEARVLAVRIMHSDDVAYEGDIICALRELVQRIAAAKADDVAAQVDVVSMSFGYFSESPHEKVATTGLWTAIDALIELGVVVICAAGNFATSREFYPAAFAREAVADGQLPVVSVGALNANGTKAMFSNDGKWVTAWARGVLVVSTYPVDVDGSRTSDLRIPVNREPLGSWPPGRESLDPDDFSGGWALWSGTSFSAPYLAALFAAALLKGAAKEGSGLQLNLPADPAADLAAVPVKRKERAMAARAELHTQQEELWQRELQEGTDAGG